MLLVLELYTKVSVHNAFNNTRIELIMPSHLGGQAPASSIEMPPPLFEEPTTAVVTPPLISDVHIMLGIGIIIVAGILIFIIKRRSRK